MRRATHSVIGVALGLTLAAHHEPIGALSLGALCSVAAVLPDIDIRLGIKHRGITHTLIALLLVGLICWHVAPELAVYVVSGYGSHLLLDMLTPYGIPLLYPLKRRLRLAKFRTGGRIDRLVGTLASCTAIGVLYLMVWG